MHEFGFLVKHGGYNHFSFVNLSEMLSLSQTVCAEQGVPLAPGRDNCYNFPSISKNKSDLNFPAP